MGGVSLLTEAWKAGLTVRVEGGRLHIRGPRRAYAIVQQIIAHKDAVLKAMSVRPENLPPEWRERWAERAAIMEHDGGLHHDQANAEAFDDILRQMTCEG
jgi:hypothetical protein